MFSIRKWIASKMFPPLTANGGQSSEANTSESGLSFIRSLSRNLTGAAFGVQDGLLGDSSGEDGDDANTTYFSIIYQHYDSIQSKHLPINEKLLVSEMYQFYYANEELNYVSSELDTFDGRKDTDRCSVLVNSLKLAQDRVISQIFRIMDLVGCERASREYRLKFPDELLVGEGTESLNSQIWFAAECLAAGSTITNNQAESNYLRPIANTLTTTLDNIRFEIRNFTNYLPKTPKITKEFIRRLEEFDSLFVSFEYDYVKAMLPIKSSIDIESLQELTFLFSETLAYSLKKGLITKEDVEGCEPNVMIALPRLSIVRGLLQGYGSVVCKSDYYELCSILQPFHSLLNKFHELLSTLEEEEMDFLEQLLATNHHNLEKASEFISQKSNQKFAENAAQMKAAKARRDNQKMKNKYLSASVDLLMVYNKCEQYDKTHPNGPDSLLDERFRSLPNIILTRVDFLNKPTPEVPSAATNPSTSAGNPPTATTITTTTSASDKRPPEAHSTGDSSDTFPSTTSSLPASNSSNGTFLTSSSSISSSSSGSIFYMDVDPNNRQRSQSVISEHRQACSNQADNGRQQKRVRPKSDNDHQHSSTRGESSVGERRAVTSAPQMESTSRRLNETASVTPLTSFFSDNSIQLDLESIYFDELAQYKLGQKKILHQFFVMISKIADKFQTNYASELRNILRTVFYFHELAEKEELERQTNNSKANKSCLLQPVNVRLGYYSNETVDDDYRVDFEVEEGIDANELLANEITNAPATANVIVDPIPSTSQSSQPQHLRRPHIECSDNNTQPVVPACTCDKSRRQQRRLSFDQLLSLEARRTLSRSISTPNGNTLAAMLSNNNFNASSSSSSGRGVTSHDQTTNADLLRSKKCRSLPSNLNISNEMYLQQQQQHRPPSCYSNKSMDDSSSINSVCSIPHSHFTNSTGTTLDDSGGACDLPTFIYPFPDERGNNSASGRGNNTGLPIIGNLAAMGSNSPRSLLLPPVWVPDEVENMCSSCGQVFNLLRRRHHCRRCGHIFCHQCSNNFVSLRCFGYDKPVRVCNHCLVEHERTLGEQYEQQQLA